MESSPRVAYIDIEADNLLRLCFEQLGRQGDYSSFLELILRGTLPREALENIEKSTVFLDPNNLVEIEYKAHAGTDPETITNEMIAFLKDIGCGKIERNYVGYPFMSLYPDEVKFETV